MRLHHLHVGYLDKASSSSSTFTLPFGFQSIRPLAPKIVLSESKMVAPPGLARVKNASTLNCTAVQPGGTTRWNPSAEQIKVLEMLYRGGMRTPNASQIERITEELGKYGRIEGKNVFYWFQNHKARERQKQKRAALLTLATLDSSSPPQTKDEEKKEACENVTSCKRRCKTWGDAALEVADGGEDMTLELFPLHPQGKA